MRERNKKQVHYLFSLPYVVILVLFVAFYFVMLLSPNIDSNRYSMTIFQIGVVLFLVGSLGMAIKDCGVIFIIMKVRVLFYKPIG